MKKFTVSEAKMLLKNGKELDQVFNCSKTYLRDFIRYLLWACSRTDDRIRLRVRGRYGTVGLVLEIFFPLKTDADIQIVFDSDICVAVDDCTERNFRANRWYDIGYTSVRTEDRKPAGFGSDLYKDKEVKDDKDKEPKEAIEDKEDIRSYNVGSSDYAKHAIQPWDIWLSYDLNPWDADIVKRVLRTKETDGRKLDYEKIIHICKERIRQIETYGK